MINRLTQIILIIFAVFWLSSCMKMTRVLSKTENTAVIQGIARTKYEAKMAAEEKAKEMFGNFEYTADAECDQEATGSANQYSASVNTFWICTYQVKKK